MVAEPPPAGPPRRARKPSGLARVAHLHAELAAHGLPRGRRVVARHASAGSTRAWPRRPSAETDVPSPTAPRAGAVRLVGRPAPVRDLAGPVAEVAPPQTTHASGSGMPRSRTAPPSAAAPVASPPPTRAACRPATRRGACRRPGRRRPSPPGRRRGAAHGLAGPRAHEPGRARAHPAGPRALPKRPARARVPGAARPDVPLGLGAPERAHGPARGGAAAGPAGPPLRPVPVVPLAREARPAAPGARARLPARPAGPVGHLRAQRPCEPPPLVVRPAPSPLAASCQASRVSPRHVFSLTTS